MTTANQLHDITVDGQRYIIKRSRCTAGSQNIYTGRFDKWCDKCTRWRPAYGQGYHHIRQTHIIMMCFCRACGHEEFVLEDWLQSEWFLTTHRECLERQSETKAWNYERSFQNNWAGPLQEAAKLALEDLDSEDIREAKIKLSTILHKIEIHKREYLAVEGWDK